MSEWKKCKLGDICSRLSSGKGISSSEIKETGKYPVYGGNGLRGYTDKSNFCGECAIIGRQGAFCGNVRFFSGEAYMTEHAVIVCANESHNTRYLSYLLSTMGLGRLSGQSAQPGLSVKTLSLQTIILPPLSEQKIIADTLSALDDKIENNNKINHNLLELSNDLFNHMISTLPKNGQIGDYCSVKSGFAFKSDWWRASGVRVIKIGSIKQDNLDLNTCSYVELDKVQSARDFLVKGGDLLIAMTGATIGKFTMVPKTNDTLLVNQRVGKFFLGDEPVKKIPFIYCQLKQPEIANEIVNRGQGSAQPNISASDIMTIPCVIPQEKEINAFNEACSPLFKLIIQNQFENRNLTVLKDTLLPRLMSGEIDVSKIEDYAAKL